MGIPGVRRSPLQISLAGISYCDGTYRISRPCSPVTVIEYVLEGEGYIVRDGVIHTVGQDTIYLLRQGEDQLYFSSAQHPWKKIFVNVSGKMAVQLSEQYGLAGEWTFNGTGLKELFLRIEEIVKRGDNGDSGRAALAAVYFEILMRLSLRRTQTAHTAEALRLQEYLDNHRNRLVGNQELATQIFRSADYCIKLFRQEFGVTPYEYQIRNKMEMACRLLRDTVLPVAQIGASLGYTDAGYFSGLFRQRCGMSPREYRKRK